MPRQAHHYIPLSPKGQRFGDNPVDSVPPPENDHTVADAPLTRISRLPEYSAMTMNNLPDHLPLTRALVTAVLAMAILGCASAEPPPASNPFASAHTTPANNTNDEEAKAARSGQIVDAPANITQYRPEMTDVVEVDAEAVNLRAVLEDLGPVAREWYQHVQTLANPFFEGRSPESRGGELAAEYIEFYLRKHGLDPAFPTNADESYDNGAADATADWISYRQPFTFDYRGQRLRSRVVESVVAIGGEPLEDGEDYAVLGISGNVQTTAPVTFVGYAIESGPDGYASFEPETDLTDRIALVLRYEPTNNDGRSKWGGRNFSEHAAIAGKIRALRDRGAAGIILVNPPNVRGSATSLERIGRSSRFGPTLNIPAVQFSQDKADKLLQRIDPDARGLQEWRRLADRGDVQAVHFSERIQVTIGAEIERSGARTDVEARNVGGILRGRGELVNEWIVIGAHFDHVGRGEFGTSPQYRGELHPGADDNASGTAGLLVLARTLAERYAGAEADENLRSIAFVAFDAEESGLHGSRHYVNRSPIPHDQIHAMINMDMIGRLRSGKLLALGVDTAAELKDRLQAHVESSGLTVATLPGGSGRSDDANFINAEIPAIHFFTGMHDDYHAPSDRAHTVNPAGARDVLRLIHHLALDLATMPEQLQFTEPGRVATRDRGYAPVRLGIRPGMGTDIDSGVQVEAVSPGTSAEEGGIERGDIIIGWDDVPIDDMRSLFEALQNHEPGDVVAITVLRGDETVTLDVRLKSGE